MKVPLIWLNDFLSPKIENVKRFADDITMTGSKVEGVTTPGYGLSGIVTGKIISISPHSNADHLTVCKVDTGDKVLSIVTGASNIKAGDHVPVALDGAILAKGVEIRTGSLRGELSEGMMCSLEELGFDSHFFPDAPENGIYILSDRYKPGTEIREAMMFGEPVIEFEITNNRSDCFSVEGLAREAAVTEKIGFVKLEPEVKGALGYRIRDALKVEVNAPDLCSRYIARGVRNVRIAPSPLWMRSRLRDAGIRPISNIVDITNYVMLELGQPMHAFDHQNIKGQIINVRRANPGEELITLDGEKHVLDNDMLVIADMEDATGLAGIMGGENSSISDATTNIIFESANFNGINIRISAKKMGMRTESSSRFEKGLDPINTKRAMDRACELVELLECGEVSEDEIDIWPVKPIPKEIIIDFDHINSFLGTDIKEDAMTDILQSIGCYVMSEAGKTICIPPTFRNDLERDVDLAEEIARFYGYNNIEPTLLAGKSTTPGGYSSEQKQRRLLSSVMFAAGFSEACTYSFMSPKIFDDLCIADNDVLRNAVKISNPLGEDYSLMRTTMLPSMLDIAKTNISRGVTAFDIFEIAKIYLPSSDDLTVLPEEREILAAITYSESDDHDEAETLFRLKGVAEELALQSGTLSVEFIPATDIPSLHPGRSMYMLVEGNSTGVIGYIHPDVAENTETNKSVAVMMLETKHFLVPQGRKTTFKPLPRFPGVSRDLSLVVKRNIMNSEIEHIIAQNAGSYLEYCKLFDVYTGQQIDKDKKSMAYKIMFRASEKTLTDEDINPAVEKIISALKTHFNADLR